MNTHLQAPRINVLPDERACQNCAHWPGDDKTRTAPCQAPVVDKDIPASMTRQLMHGHDGLGCSRFTPPTAPTYLDRIRSVFLGRH
jgi:hypothetical protein